MEKQTFEIPKGCSKVTIEQIGNTIVTSFESEKPEFKRGDVVFDKIQLSILIYSGSDETIAQLFTDTKDIYLSGATGSELEDCRFATEYEKQLLFDALAKEGKRWDAEKLEIVDLK